MLKTSRIFRNFLTSVLRILELAAQSPVGDGSGRDYHRAGLHIVTTLTVAAAATTTV